MGDMESCQSACFLRDSLRPKLPPMRKVSWLAPLRANSAIRRLSAALEQGLPSIAKGNDSPAAGAAFPGWKRASLSNARCTSAGEGILRQGGTPAAPRSCKEQQRDRRFSYSAAAAA